MRIFSKLVVVLSAFMLFAACLLKTPANDTSPQGWWAERGTVVPHDTFPADCSICHAGDDWLSIRDDFEFDHLAETGTALEGAHLAAECLRCHNDRGPVQAFAGRGCAGCHEDVHRGQLGSDCTLCHDENSWQPNEQIALHNRTRFPLAGAHAAVACWRCHEGARVGNFSRVDTQCITCHASDLADAVNPNHRALGWVDSCERCHVPTTWTSAGFNHTMFPLTGAHRSLDCQSCHAGNNFTGLDSACVACHQADYNGTTDPNHVVGGFSLSCEQCHSTNTWEGAVFNHIGIMNGCVDCHLSDFNGTTDPNHMAARFPTSCESCHTTQTWDGAKFDHAPFIITNGDHNLSCSNCHMVQSNYGIFSCTHCHEHRQSESDDEHNDVNGYVWESNACYMCHPTGDD